MVKRDISQSQTEGKGKKVDQLNITKTTTKEYLFCRLFFLTLFIFQ